MLTEHHCHILPNIDDGSKSVEMSLEMIGLMKSQGVGEIFATPHFYAHREKSVSSYLKKRQSAFESLVQAEASAADIRLGAEVAIEHGISQLEDIHKLSMADTGYILLEFPYAPFSHWMLNEITDIAYGFGLKPIIAHVHRCLAYCKKAEIEEILRLDAVFQINNEAFSSFRERRFVKALIKEGHPYLFGSDAHNLSGRKPNWDLLMKKARPQVIEGAVNIL